LFGNFKAVAENHPSSKVSAEKNAGVFAKAFNLFGNCHRGYNSSHYMSDGDIDELGNNLHALQYDLIVIL